MQNILFSMLTLLTTVVMMLPEAGAQNSGGLSAEAMKSIETFCLQWQTKGYPSERACITERSSTSSGGGSGYKDPNDQQCTDFKSKLNTAETEFNKACGVFNLKGEACEKKVKACDGYEFDEDDDEPKSKDSVDSSKYSTCPLAALKDTKEAKEKIKEFKEDKTKYEEQLAEEKEDVAKATSAIETAENERIEKNQEREAKYIKDLEEKELTDKAKVEEVKKELEAIDAKLRQMSNDLNNAKIEYSAKKLEIEGICTKVAAEEVNKRIEEDIQKAKSNVARKRNLQEQLTLISEGRSNQYDDMKQRAIDRCKKDPTVKFKERIRILDEVQKAKLQAMQNEINAMSQQRIQVTQKLTSGLSQEQQQAAQKLQQAYQKDMTNIKTLFDKKVGTCAGVQQQTGKIQKVPTSGCSGLQRELAEQMNQQAEKEDKLQQTEDMLDYYLELERVAGGFINKSRADESVDLNSAAGNFESALKDVVDACRTVEGFSPNKYNKSLSNLTGTTFVEETNENTLPQISIAGTEGDQAAPDSRNPTPESQRRQRQQGAGSSGNTR